MPFLPSPSPEPMGCLQGCSRRDGQKERTYLTSLQEKGRGKVCRWPLRHLPGTRQARQWLLSLLISFWGPWLSKAPKPHLVKEVLGVRVPRHSVHVS